MGSVNLVLGYFFFRGCVFCPRLSFPVGSSLALVLGDQNFLHSTQETWEWSLMLRDEARGTKVFG
jgi:hypothetical protein